MSFFIGNCCLKLNSFICGSNESSSLDKKKRKFKLQQQGIVNNASSNNKIINRTEPTSISSYQQHYVNVTSLHHPIQQQNSTKKSFECENNNNNNNNLQETNKYSHESSLNSFIDYRLSQRSPSILSNGIIIKNIILRRNYPNERLGLTLCYGITSKSTTNIYIQQVDKESIAGHQGELRSGDQIVKINNHRVTSRDEAINLVNGACRILLQIIRFEFPNQNFSTIQSAPLTEDDSGVTLAGNTDFETTNDCIHQKSSNECNNLVKSCISLSSSGLNYCSNCRRIQSYSQQFQYRRCLSLNDLRRPCSFLTQNLDHTKHLIRSQSLFGMTTDNEQIILKPLPFHYQQQTSIENRDDSDSGLVCGRSRSNDSHRSRNNQNQSTLKYSRRRYREQCLKEQYQTTDDEPMSELKLGRYWTRQQRKEHLAKAKQYRERAKYFQQCSINRCSDSTTEDYNLLNRIFLRENQHELKQKPHLAYKYGQQSSIERDRLKRIIQQNYFNRIRSQSATTVSISTTFDQSSIVIL
ncbi:unnamed protein product [Rotaria sordida]|uniref:PDZ domain-containing protein n=1 Tax=Rotaria sordida TaxID=392033 RepID=A0A815KJJ7_9BILA|nr:unnamed protein product [Rotaria sordida]CAF1397121.1 unnamed protein product [Rotaria sordida]